LPGAHSFETSFLPLADLPASIVVSQARAPEQDVF
jgi:hypothetical protein